MTNVMRTFDNPNNLHVKILERRFYNAGDINASLTVNVYDSLLSPSTQTFHVSVDSILDDETVISLLASPATTEENTYVTEFDTDRTNLRIKFDETTARLLVIENDMAMTNANAQQYIRDLAKNQRLIIRLLYKMRITS